MIRNTNSSTPLTAVVYSEKDAIRFLSEQPQVDQIYPLTPDAHATLLGIELPILKPLDYFTDYGHRKVIALVRSVERQLHPLLSDEENLSDASKETFRGLFHVLACSAIYIWYTIKDTGPWLVNASNKWQNSKRLPETHKLIMKEVFETDGPILRIDKEQPRQFTRLSRILTNIILRSIEGKKCLVTTGSVYGLKELKTKVKELDSDCHFVDISGLNKWRIISSFYELITMKKAGGTTIYVDSFSWQYTDKVSAIIYQLLDKVEDPIVLNVKEVIIPQLIDNVTYTESLIDGVKNVFDRIRPQALIAHYMRWHEGAVLGEIAKKSNIPSILISHGSIPKLQETASWYEFREEAQGCLISPLATETVTQSPNAENAAFDFMPELKRSRFQPIMWGYKKNNHILRGKKRVRTILHAGTYKALGMRPWIYETSNEFISGLRHLVQAVKELDKAYLIIRIRPNRECSVENLRKLMPESDNYEVKTSGNFLDDLKNADLLISFSSTTIEEALYAHRPVGLFGGSERYRYLPGSDTPPTRNKRSAVYHLSESNLVEMLSSILDVHTSKPLTNEELSGYVWPENVLGRKEFIEKILNEESGSIVEPTIN